MSILLLNEDELRQAINTSVAIEAIEAAFFTLAQGRTNSVEVAYLPLPETHGQVEIKGTYLSEAPYYIVKTANTFLDNPTINLPVQNEVLMVFDAATGFPAAIILDRGYLTQIQTGAAGSVVARHLANENLHQVAIIGTGQQAYMQLKMLLSVRKVRKVSIWGRSLMNVDTYARRLMEEHDLDIEIAPSVQAAIESADLIITATSSEQPLIEAEWLKPGVHITAIGSNSSTKQELHPEVLRRADVIIADKLSQCAEIGEIHHGLVAGTITMANVQGELSDLVAGKIPGRTSPEQITVADLTGRSVQDSVMAILALEKALFLGLGQRLT